MESVFLNGGVRKRSLPLLAVPTGPEAPELKRLDLPQGELAQLSPAGTSFGYIAWMQLKEGAVRGNHYHHRKEEWLYLIAGEVALIVEDRESKERETITLAAGDLVVIDPEIAHALRPFKDGQGIEFSPQPFDRDDSEPYPLVE